VKQIEFPSQEAYVHAQLKTVRRRSGNVFFSDREVARAAAWLRSAGARVRSGICHGARNGLEVAEFSTHFPRAAWVGTDLFPHSGKSAAYSPKGVEVVKHDFSERKPEWVGVWDVVYSNSLDHARDPKAALSVWLEQLSPDGACFVQWTAADLTVGGGDCFGGTLWEWVGLANSVGFVEDLLYCRTTWMRANILRTRGLESVLIVIRPPSKAGGPR